MKNSKLTHMDRNELIQRTFPYLLKRLEDAGINATPQVDPQTNGYILTVDTMRFNVENLRRIYRAATRPSIRSESNAGLPS